MKENLRQVRRKSTAAAKSQKLKMPSALAAKTTDEHFRRVQVMLDLLSKALPPRIIFQKTPTQERPWSLEIWHARSSDGEDLYFSRRDQHKFGQVPTREALHMILLNSVPPCLQAEALLMVEEAQGIVRP